MVGDGNAYDLPFELRETPDAFEQPPARHPSLFPEPVASLLGEQLLILQRMERSLESLLSLTLRQANALENLADASDERRSNS